MKKTAKKHNVLRFPTKPVRKANIQPFGSVGVQLDPHSPLWANRQVSALEIAIAVVESLDLTGKELEFLQDSILPRMIYARSPEFKTS